ncbi:MAG TPA: nucleotidyltransferase domain-containing protein [bacterium]|jgi:predicted nucleotidyltransferase
MADTDVSKRLEQITGEAKAALGENLLSLVLYGSHARGEAHARSDINLFMVVKDSHATSIKPLLSVVPGWQKLGATAPVIFEFPQLQRSADTFALELAEMACTHKILLGDDPFKGYSPDWKEVRNELEHESRQKTIYLKRRWMASGGKDKAYEALICETVPGYLALLRGAALLNRRSVDPLSLDEAFVELSRLTWFAPMVWKRLRGMAKQGQKVDRAELLPLILEYIEQARSLVRYFDSLPDE